MGEFLQAQALAQKKLGVRALQDYHKGIKIKKRGKN